MNKGHQKHLVIVQSPKPSMGKWTPVDYLLQTVEGLVRVGIYDRRLLQRQEP